MNNVEQTEKRKRKERKIEIEGASENIKKRKKDKEKFTQEKNKRGEKIPKILVNKNSG